MTAETDQEAEEETFGLCRADFDVWVAEMFADVDDERFEAATDSSHSSSFTR